MPRYPLFFAQRNPVTRRWTGLVQTAQGGGHVNQVTLTDEFTRKSDAVAAAKARW